MQYQKVFIDHFAYELPTEVITSRELEERLWPVYNKLKIPLGQFEAMTGIRERRWWPKNFAVSDGAVQAAQKALDACQMNAKDIDIVIYAGVCRDLYEPATACRVAAKLGITGSAQAYDVSNACLGVMNGMIDVANRIELGQIRAGLVVSCESSRDITEDVILQMLEDPVMERFTKALATLTGGSGAAAVLLTDGSFGADSHRLIGGVNRSALDQHELCRWGVQKIKNRKFEQFITTDAVNVLRHGLALGVKTWQLLLQELGWGIDLVDKIISHQVGKAHRESIMRSVGLPLTHDYPTYELLGNIGSVSVPLTAAMAAERGFLCRGDQVGLLGIGSGLNCLMMGVKW